VADMKNGWMENSVPRNWNLLFSRIAFRCRRMASIAP
jgi:hypothetical protein